MQERSDQKEEGSRTADSNQREGKRVDMSSSSPIAGCNSSLLFAVKPDGAYGSERFTFLVNEVEAVVWRKSDKSRKYSKGVNLVFALSDVLSRGNIDIEILRNQRRRIEIILLLLLTQQPATHSLRLLSARIVVQLYCRSDPYKIHGFLSDLLSVCIGIYPPALSLPIFSTTLSNICKLPYATLEATVKVSAKDVKGVSTVNVPFVIRACALDVVGHIIPCFSSLSGHCIPYIISSTEKIESKCPEIQWRQIALAALSRCIEQCGISGVSITNDLLSISLNAINTKIAVLTEAGFDLLGILVTKHPISAATSTHCFLDLCLKYAGDEDDGVRRSVPYAIAACLFSYTELKQEETLSATKKEQGQESVNQSPLLSEENLWRRLLAPLGIVADSKADQFTSLLAHCQCAYSVKNPPKDVPSALIWLAQQIAYPPSNYATSHPGDGFFDKTQAMTHNPHHKRHESARWIFGNCDGEYKNGARVAFFRETFSSAFITFCQLAKLRQPRTLTATMNLILSIATTCSGLPASDWNPDITISRLLAEMCSPERLIRVKSKQGAQPTIENPIFASSSLSCKLGLMRGRSVPLEVLHIARCLVYIGQELLRILAVSESSILHIIEYSLIPTLSLGIRTMASGQKNSIANSVNPLLLSVVIQLTEEACVRAGPGLSFLTHSITEHLIKCIGNHSKYLRNEIQVQAASTLRIALVTDNETSEVLGIILNLLTISHQELRAVTIETVKTDPEFLQDALCRTSGYTLGLIALVFAARSSECGVSCALYDRILSLIESLTPEVEKNDQTAIGRLSPRQLVPEASAGRKLSAAILLHGVLLSSSPSWQYQQLTRIISILKIFMGRKPVDALRALSELETSGRLHCLHKEVKYQIESSNVDSRYVSDGLDSCTAQPDNSESLEGSPRHPSHGTLLDVPSELESSPSDISILSNLTDELLVLLSAFRAVVALIEYHGMAELLNHMTSSQWKIIVVFMTNVAQLAAYLPHPLVVLSNPPMSQSKAFELFQLSMKAFPVERGESSSEPTSAPLFIANSYGDTFVGHDVSRGKVLMALREAVYDGLSKIPCDFYDSRTLQLLNCVADDLTKPACSPCGPVSAIKTICALNFPFLFDLDLCVRNETDSFNSRDCTEHVRQFVRRFANSVLESIPNRRLAVSSEATETCPLNETFIDSFPPSAILLSDNYQFLSFSSLQSSKANEIDEYVAISTPTVKPSWIDVLASDASSCNGLSTNLFIQHLSGHKPQEETKAFHNIEAAWKSSVIKFFAFLMSRSSVNDATRLTVFQHLLRSLQRPAPGPFSTSENKKKGPLEKTSNVVAAAQRSLMRHQSKSKQHMNFSWTESPWTLPSAEVKTKETRENFQSSQCYHLDSELYDQQSCIPISILIAVRMFLLNILFSNFLNGSFCEQLLSSDDSIFLPSNSPSSDHSNHSTATPCQILPHVVSRYSPTSHHSSNTVSSTPSPSQSVKSSSVLSLTFLEFQSLHNLFQEGCASESCTTRILSAECIGILGAIACISADTQELSTVVQILARWAETYSNLTRSLVGIALGALCRYSFLTLRTSNRINNSTQLPSIPRIVTANPIIPLLPNDLSLTASYQLPPITATLQPRSSSSISRSDSYLLDASPIKSPHDTPSLAQEFWSRVVWTMIGVLTQHSSPLVTRLVTQGLATMIDALGVSVLPLVEDIFAAIKSTILGPTKIQEDALAPIAEAAFRLTTRVILPYTRSLTDETNRICVLPSPDSSRSTSFESPSINTELAAATRHAHTLMNKLLALLTCIQMHVLSQSFPTEAQRELAERLRSSKAELDAMAVLTADHTVLSLIPSRHHVSADVWLQLSYHALLRENPEFVASRSIDNLSPTFHIIGRLSHPQESIRLLTLAITSDLMASGYSFLDTLPSETENVAPLGTQLNPFATELPKCPQPLIFMKFLMTYLDVETSPVCRRLLSNILAMHLIQKTQLDTDMVILSRFLKSCIQPSTFPFETIFPPTSSVLEDQKGDEDTTEQRLSSSPVADCDHEGDIGEFEENEVNISVRNGKEIAVASLQWMPGLRVNTETSTVESMAHGLASAFARISVKQDASMFTSLAKMGKKLKLTSNKDKSGVSTSKLKKLQAMGLGLKYSVKGRDNQSFWIAPRLVQFQSVKDFGTRVRGYSISCLKILLASISSKLVDASELQAELNSLISLITLQISSGCSVLMIEALELLQMVVHEFGNISSTVIQQDRMSLISPFERQILSCLRQMFNAQNLSPELKEERIGSKPKTRSKASSMEALSSASVVGAEILWPQAIILSINITLDLLMTNTISVPDKLVKWIWDILGGIVLPVMQEHDPQKFKLAAPTGFAGMRGVTMLFVTSFHAAINIMDSEHLSQYVTDEQKQIAAVACWLCFRDVTCLDMSTDGKNNELYRLPKLTLCQESDIPFILSIWSELRTLTVKGLTLLCHPKYNLLRLLQNSIIFGEFNDKGDSFLEFALLWLTQLLSSCSSQFSKSQNNEDVRGQNKTELSKQRLAQRNSFIFGAKDKSSFLWRDISQLSSTVVMTISYLSLKVINNSSQHHPSLLPIITLFRSYIQLEITNFRNGSEASLLQLQPSVTAIALMVEEVLSIYQKNGVTTADILLVMALLPLIDLVAVATTILCLACVNGTQPPGQGDLMKYDIKELLQAVFEVIYSLCVLLSTKVNISLDASCTRESNSDKLTEQMLFENINSLHESLRSSIRSLLCSAEETSMPFVFLSACRSSVPQLISKWKSIVEELVRSKDGRTIQSILLKQWIHCLSKCHRNGNKINLQDLLYKLALFVPSLSQQILNWDPTFNSSSLVAELSSLFCLADGEDPDPQEPSIKLLQELTTSEKVLISLTAVLCTVAQSMGSRCVLVSQIKGGNKVKVNSDVVVCFDVFYGLVPPVVRMLLKLTLLDITKDMELLMELAERVQSAGFSYLLELYSKTRSIAEVKFDQKVQLLSELLKIPVIMQTNMSDIPSRKMQKELGAFLFSLSQIDRDLFRGALIHIVSTPNNDTESCDAAFNFLCSLSNSAIPQPKEIRSSVELLIRAHVSELNQLQNSVQSTEAAKTIFSQSCETVPQSQSPSHKIELKMKFQASRTS